MYILNIAKILASVNRIDQESSTKLLDSRVRSPRFAGEARRG